jgi:ABC-type transporter Mla maintaining outer membrane lipid asymmetry permease subunit MlaE
MVARVFLDRLMSAGDGVAVGFLVMVEDQYDAFAMNGSGDSVSHHASAAVRTSGIAHVYLLSEVRE